MELTKDEIVKLLQEQEGDFCIQIELNYPEEEKDGIGRGSATNS